MKPSKSKMMKHLKLYSLLTLAVLVMILCSSCSKSEGESSESGYTPATSATITLQDGSTHTLHSSIGLAREASGVVLALAFASTSQGNLLYITLPSGATEKAYEDPDARLKLYKSDFLEEIYMSYAYTGAKT